MPTFRDIKQFNAVADAEVNPDWSLQISATQRVTLRQIANIYTKSLIIKVGETSKSYNTKTEVSVDINPSSIGAANKNHTHNTTDINSPGKLTLYPPLIDGGSRLQPLIEHSNLSNTTKNLSLPQMGMFCKTLKFGSLLEGNVDIWLTTKIDLQGINFIFQFKLLKDVTLEGSLEGYSKIIYSTKRVTLISSNLSHTSDPVDIAIFLDEYSPESYEYQYLKYLESKLCKRSKMSDRTSISPLLSLLTTYKSDIVKGGAYIYLSPDNIHDFGGTDESFLSFEVGIHVNDGVTRLDTSDADGLTLFNQLQVFIPFEDIGIIIS